MGRESGVRTFQTLNSYLGRILAASRDRLDTGLTRWGYANEDIICCYWALNDHNSMGKPVALILGWVLD